MKQLISILLATLMLLPNIGLTLSTHFCGGHAVEHSLSIGLADLSCGMMDEVGKGSSSLGMENHCCSNQYQLVQLDDDVTDQKNGIESPIAPLSPCLLPLNPYGTLQRAVDYAPLVVAMPPCIPPLIPQNRQVLFQTFIV